MSVASELSSEVAEAILFENVEGGDAGRLLEIAVALRATLRQLSREEQRRRRSKIFLDIQPAQSWGGAPGSH